MGLATSSAGITDGTARATAASPATPKGRWGFLSRSLAARITTGFLVVSLIGTGVGIAGIVQLDKLNDRTADVYAKATIPISSAGEMQSTWMYTRALMYVSAMGGAATIASLQKVLIPAADKKFDLAYQTYLSHDPSPAGKTIADGMNAAMLVLRNGRDTVVFPAAAKGDYRAALTFIVRPDIAKRLTAYNTGGDKIVAVEKVRASAIATAAAKSYRDTRTALIILLAIGLAISLTLALVIARSVVRPLRRTHAVLDRVAHGDLTPRVPVSSVDEVGQMSSALNESLDHITEVVRQMAHAATALSGSSQQLATVAAHMSIGAEQSGGQIDQVSTSAADVSRHVQTVAAGTEEMTVSIQEIARNAAEAVRVSADAAAVTAETTQTMAKLNESSAEIGSVIKVITSIAEQTNLLALNATIEAARAGDAGKGFAVVASEVKDLAQETAKATEDISRRVEAIQADTEGAVTAISRISEVIERVNGYQTTIASAVEEQTATTSEMGRSAQNAASSSISIADNLTAIAQASQDTVNNVRQTDQAAADLAELSSKLTAAVAQFTI